MPKRFIAVNIRLMRKLYHISQQSLATQTGMTRNNIASYEMGIVEPTAENLLKIARFFDIDPYWFISKNLKKELEGVNELTGAYVSERFASRKQEKGITLDDFIQENKDMKKILEGFKEFYQFRIKMDEESSPEFKNLASNLEGLLELMSELLQSNFELVEKIRARSN